MTALHLTIVQTLSAAQMNRNLTADVKEMGWATCCCVITVRSQTLGSECLFLRAFRVGIYQQNKPRSLFRVRDTGADFPTSFAQFHSFHLLLLHKREKERRQVAEKGFWF